jgi:hypothetical protein
LAIVGPSLASLLVGILYAHFVGDVIAAWTIALYIVTCTLGEYISVVVYGLLTRLVIEVIGALLTIITVLKH